MLSPSEVFRFVNLRGPLDVETRPPSGGVVLAAGKPTPLHADLAGLRAAGRPRAEIEGRAAKFIGSDDYALRAPLPLDLAPLGAWLAGQSVELTPEALADGVRQALGSSPQDLLAAANFQTTRSRLSDSVLALTVARGSAADKAALTRLLRLAGVIESVPGLSAGAVRTDRLLRARVLLPADVFPLPPTADPHAQQESDASSSEQEDRAARDKRLAELAAHIEVKRQAIVELSSALRADSNKLRKAAVSATPPVAVTRATTRRAAAAKATGKKVLHPAPPSLPPGVLSHATAAGLAAGTRSALSTLGIATDFVDVPYAVGTLEGSLASDVAKLFQGKASRSVTRIGNRWIPAGGLGGVFGTDLWSTPGPCGTPAADPPNSAPTVPALTQSPLRPVGIADLLLVRQDVKRYALGEIAHVENIMMGESRRRLHRETTRTTETVTVETEQTTEESRDLQTTDRYELQQETDAVIKEDSSRQIALSISASYGPFASGTANINSAHGDSKETTTKNAMQYAREVTDKAVKKVQDRVLQRRTVTTMQEVVELSRHGFDNTAGTHHVQGIYRWVDKIYQAQVVSYGLRMMFELVVPEPAAFYRYASSSLPPEGLKLDQPDPPGYCHQPAGVFVPLVPGDITESNYPFWVSKYGVSGVNPPPPMYRTVGITLSEEPASGDDFTMLMSNDLQVPAGWLAERAWVGGEALYWDNSGSGNPDPFMTFHVGRSAIPVNESAAMNGEDGTIPVVGHGYSVAAMAVTVEVLCARAPETYAAWQMSTFNAIIGAYNDLQSQYQAALARLEQNAQAGTGIAGRNPDVNRDVERRELKRQCIALITGQQFDDFDAMRRGVPPYGYPEASLSETSAEAGYIQFFEQAFEWANISYRFYPYFWGRKSEWPDLLRQDDTDPLFAQFLQAGAARVQLPVHPGYEQAVMYLLQTANKPWEDDDSAFQIQGDLYQSIVDEIINEQLGAFTKGQGTIAVQQGSVEVTGTDTAFDAKLHDDRDMMIENRVYRVAHVTSPTQLTLDRPYRDPSATGAAYSFGGRLVGDPWEVRLPTSLVYLQDGNALPDLTNE